MVEKLAHKAAAYMVAKDVIPAGKQPLATYGIFEICSNILHILMLLAVGILLSATAEIAVFALFFCSLKGYIGGAHLHKHWHCLWGFTALSALTVLLARFLMYADMPVWGTPAMSGFALIMVFRYAPVLE